MLAARLWLIGSWGSPVPFWDEWDADPVLYRGWLTGTLSWHDLFAAANEHRIVLTRLADLALFAVVGRWDPWAQLFLNATLHATTAAMLAGIFWPALTPRTRVGLVAVLAVLFTATFGWQNALWGIQSNVYFAILLSVIAVAGVAQGPPFSWRWWCGWLAALLALFANGGGVLAAAVALIITFAAPAQRRTRLSALALFGLVCLGWFLRVTPAHQAPLRAQSLSQFLEVLAHGLSWPQIDQNWVWIVTQLPLAWLILDLWRRRTMPDAIERCACALGLLAILHAAAVAYSRGAGLPEFRPLSRYQDALQPGVAAQLFAALRLASRSDRLGRLLLAGWLTAVGIGLITLTATNLTLHLPYKRAQNTANLALVREYLAKPDPTVFRRDPIFPGPHPRPEAVESVLTDPLLRPVLPGAFLASDETNAARPPWPARCGGALTALMAVALAGALAASTRPRAPAP